MNANDRSQFREYLRNCSNAQVYGVLEKEETAGRDNYAVLAHDELERRGLEKPQ